MSSIALCMRRVPTEMASSLPEIRECCELIKINFIVETPRLIDVRLVGRRRFNEIDARLTACCGLQFDRCLFTLCYFVLAAFITMA